MANHPQQGKKLQQGEKIPMKLGINGLGRIGKLTVWHHVARGSFSELVVNIGNQVYQKASETYMKDYLLYSERQNVSSDIIGNPRAAAVIEGVETHTRTAPICIDLSKIPGIPPQVSPKEGGSSLFEIPVTQVVVYGWYDNELGSYTNVLGDMTVKIAQSLC